MTDPHRQPPPETPDPLAATRHHLARALLPPPPPARLGEITLHPHQTEAIARLRPILERHHGALLADDVGLGKTFVALGVARHYAHLHVIAPASLRDMWHTAARQADQRFTWHSLQQYSRGAAGMLRGAERTLVVIDEAHALRNPSTARYRAIAQAVNGCDILLISATPLHNRPRDLLAVMALFQSVHAPPLSPLTCHRLIVRRRTKQSADATTRPAVHTHPPHPIPQDQETLQRILALPAPLPAQDGAVAGALIRLGLLRAWCSSDAALSHALRRRRLRSEALRDALIAGRHPTQQELRSWVVGDFEGQLAFPELLATTEVADDSLRERLEHHLAGLADLAQHHAANSQGDAHRVAYLRQLMTEHTPHAIVAFSQYSRTIEALFRALADIGGIGMLTSQSARIASGRLSRRELLHGFAPLAHGRPPPPLHQRVQLLLTTDLLAEGINLQDAAVVLHLDLPWTTALRDQRVGRCARLGSPHPVVHVHRLRPSTAAMEALQLETRLTRKQAMIHDMLGGSPHRRRHPADVDAAVHARLHRWIQPQAARAPRDIRIAAQRGTITGALIRLENDAGAHLLAVTPTATPRPSPGSTSRWRVHAAPGRIAELIRASDQASDQASDRAGEACLDHQAAWARHARAITRALRSWRRQVRLRESLVVTPFNPAARSGHRSDGATRVRQRISQFCAQLTPVERQQHQAALRQARDCLHHARGAAAEQALAEWSAKAGAHPDGAWLMAWRSYPALAEQVPEVPQSSAAPHGRWRIRAVLLLVTD